MILLFVQCVQVVIALTIPRRLLWPIPLKPGEFSSLEGRSENSNRVLPNALISAIKGFFSRVNNLIFSFRRISSFLMTRTKRTGDNSSYSTYCKACVYVIRTSWCVLQIMQQYQQHLIFLKWTLVTVLVDRLNKDIDGDTSTLENGDCESTPFNNGHEN